MNEFEEFQDTAKTKNTRRKDIKNHEFSKYEAKIAKAKALLADEENKEGDLDENADAET